MSQPTLSLSDVPDEFLDKLVSKHGTRLFVVCNARKTNVLMDPATKLPFNTTNIRVAEKIAREVGRGAFACTLKDAFDHILKSRLT